ncbi:hypothetical protein [Algoriphagus halophilus]|uniref:hypothetical protein n=1 Tax=Algoriphagus halophilus TaxID=226505 RepID=UPI00358FEF47
MKKLILTLVLIGFYSITFAQKLSKIEEKLIAEVEKNYEQTVALLEEVTNINSGSLNLEGVEAVSKVFEREFQKIGFETEWYKLPPEAKRAGHFIATRNGSKGKKIFIIGHLDTVFEKDMPFTPFTF